MNKKSGQSKAAADKLANCCATHISVVAANSGRSLRFEPTSAIRTNPPLGEVPICNMCES